MTKAKRNWLPFDGLLKNPSLERRAPILWYGGKDRDADWILANLPSNGWSTFVDVFGGSGAIAFRIGNSGKVIIYNDIGNVANFMRVLATRGEELYRALYFTPYSREEYEVYGRNWPEAMERGDEVEWARRWFICLQQGYAHTEWGDPWKIAVTVNNARAQANRVDDLPGIIDRIRTGMHIEKLDFVDLIKIYDRDTTLFYCDPPYIDETRAEGAKTTYKNEMPLDRHKELLRMLNQVKGQVVVSMYHHELYDKAFTGWRVVEKTAKSSIQNKASMEGRADRTEVLWIKEREYGLWAS
jgi:DNA adenine methylase